MPNNTEIIEKRRYPRYPAEFPVEVKVEQKFKNITSIIKGNLSNLSEGGICLLSDEFIPESPYVKIKIDPAPWSSPLDMEAQIVWHDALPEKGYKCGVKFIKISDKELFVLRKILDRVQTELSLDPKFVEITQSFKDFMSAMEKYCNDFDNHSPTEKQRITFIEKEKKYIFRELDKYFLWLWDIVRDFSKNKYKEHQRYLQDELITFFVRETAPLNKQIYEKPLGYRGDYVAMNYLYENGHPGFSTYGKLVDKYILNLPVARGVIYRRKFFCALISKTINESKDRKVRISSFACGPAVEMLDILKTQTPRKKVKFICVDGEVSALEHIRTEIRRHKKEIHRNFKVSLIKENILDLVRHGTKRPRMFKNQNLIYCAGFIDYVSRYPATKTIKYLFDLLKDGGKLIIVNISSENRFRVYLEMLGEWHLHHRSPEELLQLASGLEDAKDIHVEPDPETKTNLFLVITK